MCGQKEVLLDAFMCFMGAIACFWVFYGQSTWYGLLYGQPNQDQRSDLGAREKRKIEVKQRKRRLIKEDLPQSMRAKSGQSGSGEVSRA